MEKTQTQKKLLIGVLILIAGMALLLANLGIIDYEIKRYIFRWEAFLMGLGIIFLLSNDKKGPGIVLLVIGSAFYLKNTDIIPFQFNFWQIFWPAMLIFAGIMIIFRRRIDPPHCEKKNLIDEGDYIDEIAVFGGSERVVLSQSFKGGKILAIFGGSTFNLSRAKLAPGKNYIDVMAVFGGMKLIVPDDWNIKIEVVSIFGAVTDSHRIRILEPGAKTESELIIKGIVVFGGGEIKSF